MQINILCRNRTTLYRQSVLIWYRNWRETSGNFYKKFRILIDLISILRATIYGMDIYISIDNNFGYVSITSVEY